jgi:hypothetical protein
MIRRLRATLLVLVFSAACLADNASAQTGPIGRPSTTQGTGPILSAYLSETDLARALRDLDPGTRVRNLYARDSNERLGVQYSLVLRCGTETRRVVIDLLFRQNILKFQVPLTRTLTLPELPADIEARLAEYNRSLTPCQLVWHPHQDGTRTLLAAMDSTRPASAQELHVQLSRLLQKTEEARPLWGPLSKELSQ